MVNTPSTWVALMAAVSIVSGTRNAREKFPNHLSSLMVQLLSVALRARFPETVRMESLSEILISSFLTPGTSHAITIAEPASITSEAHLPLIIIAGGGRIAGGGGGKTNRGGVHFLILLVVRPFGVSHLLVSHGFFSRACFRAAGSMTLNTLSNILAIPSGVSMNPPLTLDLGAKSSGKNWFSEFAGGAMLPSGISTALYC
mmetsp:Transcript_14395/g.17276  ORF Transcript_14395/g.17276 Transcript_14395/m.17276 type:complete len:201 (-) Transcript_14395:153-755(-)